MRACVLVCSRGVIMVGTGVVRRSTIHCYFKTTHPFICEDCESARSVLYCTLFKVRGRKTVNCTLARQQWLTFYNPPVPTRHHFFHRGKGHQEWQRHAWKMGAPTKPLTKANSATNTAERHARWRAAQSRPNAKQQTKFHWMIPQEKGATEVQSTHLQE